MQLRDHIHGYEPTELRIETKDPGFYGNMRGEEVKTWFGHQWLLRFDNYTTGPGGFHGTLIYRRLEKTMGTKEQPAKNDCFHRALPDEPTFTLLARDPMFAPLIYEWATRRQSAINCGDRPISDQHVVNEARNIASKGEDWRKENNGAWRKPEAPKLKIGDLYRWLQLLTGNTIMVRLIALEGDEACIHDGDRMVIVNKGALS